MAALSAFKRCRILYNRSTLIQQCLKHKAVSTHYDILGVSRSATAVEIKNAYIKMTKELHPDKADKIHNGDNDEFIKVQEAYKILSKDQDKKDYDSLIFAAEDYQKYRLYEVEANPFVASYRLHAHGIVVTIIGGVIIPYICYYAFREFGIHAMKVDTRKKTE